MMIIVMPAMCVLVMLRVIIVMPAMRVLVMMVIVMRLCMIVVIILVMAVTLVIRVIMGIAPGQQREAFRLHQHDLRCIRCQTVQAGNQKAFQPGADPNQQICVLQSACVRWAKRIAVRRSSAFEY